MKEKFLKIYNSIKPAKIEIIVAISIAIIMLLLFVYVDLESLTIWSTNMLDVLFNKDITKYYEYTASNIYNAPHQYVSGTLYNFMPWAIWNIPIWILQRFLNFPILKTPLSLIWSKLFLVFCLIITLYFAYKIVMELTKDKNKALFTVFLSGTFFYTYVGVFYAGQTDIQICMFATISLYMLLKNKEKWFLLFASLAVATKYFFFFPIIAIILLLEKDIFKIIKKLFLIVLPILIFSLIVHNFPMYDISSKANPIFNMLEGLINSSITIMNGGKLSLFILSEIIIYFLSYITKPKDEKERNYYVIYYTVASLMVMFMFSNFQFYRMILLMPFMYILFSLNHKNLKLNILIDTILCVSSSLMLIVTDVEYFFSPTHALSKGILSYFINFNNITNITLGKIITSTLGQRMILSILSTVTFAMMLLILVINHPKIKIKNEENIDRWLIWIRLLLVVPYILFTVLLVI